MVRSSLLWIIISVTICTQCRYGENEMPSRPNVLFIAVDDLRPELGCYGATHVSTPNFDRLAEMSTLFTQAYCQQAVCAPSRNSIMTGLRPDAMGIYNLYTFFRKQVPGVTTLPQHFKNNGYFTERIGKIYHTGHGNLDDSLSWSQPAAKLWRPEIVTRGDTVGLERDFPAINEKKLPFYRSSQPEKNMSDVVSTDYAVKRLGQLKDTAFFFAVGFSKPHLPFVAPAKYWDLYNPGKIEIPSRTVPEGMPGVALHQFGELRKYHGIPEDGPLDDETSRNLIHGYYAAVSLVDAQIGKLLQAIEDNDLLDNTIIVLWGDHGWKLGDYGGWCKHTNFEVDTRVPLFIMNPKDRAGQKSNSIAELVDLYPTICDLANLPLPDHLEGQSLIPILKDPTAKVKEVALSQYPRGKSLGYDRKNEWMGYSLKSGNLRFTRWQKYENPNEVLAMELYDHSSGPVAIKNLAIDSNYTRDLERMNNLLNQELSKYHRHKPEKSD
ncbi:MAG: sulfatase [Saprospiraceae bacterium]|nr:sulfatase [Saprospiraceae bacterium]